MSWVPKTWKNRSEGAPTTPVNAAGLNDLETRIGTLADSVESATQIIRAGSTSAQIVAAFATQADGQRFTFEESDDYSLANVEIDVTADIIVDAERATITQTGDLKSIFVVKADVNPTIDLKHGILTGERYDAEDDGAYQGLERKAMRCAAVFHGGDGGNVRVRKATGFYAGVSRYPWAAGSTTLRAEGDRVRGGTVRVDDFLSCDMGILSAGVENPDFWVEGEPTCHPDSIHPPHAHYSTETRTSVGGTYVVRGRDSTPPVTGDKTTVAHAGQFKGCLSGSFDVQAIRCHGVVAFGEDTSMEGIAVGRECIATDAGQVSFVSDSDTDRVILREGSRVEFAAGESDSRALRTFGGDHEINLLVEADLDTSSDDYWCIVAHDRGATTIKINNRGEGGRRGVLVEDCADPFVALPYARNVRDGVVLQQTFGDDVAPTNPRIKVDPNRITFHALGSSDKRVVRDLGTTDGTVEVERRWRTYAGASTALPRFDASSATHFRAQITDNTNMTVLNPLCATAGMRITVEVWNNTGGALGTLSWDSAFALPTAWSQPGAGSRKMIEFAYNGTQWREVART